MHKNWIKQVKGTLIRYGVIKVTDSRKNWIKQMKEISVPRAIREFTDREELRTAYHDMVKKCKTNGGNNCYVINYHGIGGIGKTTLLRKLQSEIEEKYGKNLSKEYLILHLDFETIMPNSISALVSLRSQIIELRPNMQFPMFDEAIGKLHRNNTVLDEEGTRSIFEKKSLFNDIVDAVSEFVPGLNVVKIGLKRAFKTMRELQRRAATDYNFLEQIQIHDEARIIKSLPYCFAHDINYGLQNEDTILLFFIDTYERLVTEAEGSSKWTPSMQADDWLCGSQGLIRNLPSSVFAIAGREKIKWKEFDSFWNNNLETHVIDHLSEEDSNSFFSKCGINSALWHGLYQLTGGEPVFMDLCVDQYEDIVRIHIINGEQGYIPNISEFGENTNILVERHTRYVGDDMRDALYLAASMRKWDSQTLHYAAGALGITIQPLQFKRLCSLSYVSTDNKKIFFMHSIIADILSKNLPLEERKIAVDALIQYSEMHMELEWVMESICSVAGTDLLSFNIVKHAMKMGAFAKSAEKYKRANKYYMFALDTYIALNKTVDETVEEIINEIYTNAGIGGGDDSELLSVYNTIYDVVCKNDGTDSISALDFKLNIAEKMKEIDSFWDYRVVHLIENRDFLLEKAFLSNDEFLKMHYSSKNHKRYTNEAIEICEELLLSFGKHFHDAKDIDKKTFCAFRERIGIVLSSGDDLEILAKAIECMGDSISRLSWHKANAYIKLSYLTNDPILSVRYKEQASECIREYQSEYKEIRREELILTKDGMTDAQVSYAAAEVLEILCYAENEDNNLVDNIPSLLLSFFIKISYRLYKWHLDPNKELGDQTLSNATEALLGMIYAYYWSTPEEKEESGLEI